jgi:hypothetical protein
MAAEAGMKANVTFKQEGALSRREKLRSIGDGDGIRRPDLHNRHKNEKDQLLV